MYCSYYESNITIRHSSVWAYIHMVCYIVTFDSLASKSGTLGAMLVSGRVCDDLNLIFSSQLLMVGKTESSITTQPKLWERFVKYNAPFTDTTLPKYVSWKQLRMMDIQKVPSWKLTYTLFARHGWRWFFFSFSVGYVSSVEGISSSTVSFSASAMLNGLEVFQLFEVNENVSRTKGEHLSWKKTSLENTSRRQTVFFFFYIYIKNFKFLWFKWWFFCSNPNPPFWFSNPLHHLGGHFSWQK